MKKPIMSSATLGLGIVLALISIQPAAASCGASFCAINTNWNLQGFAPEEGIRVDVRYEYIKQDQLMSGNEKVSSGQFSRHHDEVKSSNRNWLMGVDYTFNADWSMSVSAPIVDRNHSHIHNHRGAKLPETWNFTEMGDLRMTARRQWMTEQQDANALSYYGMDFGFKLPTGEHDIRNASGDLAERTLQPGTGTTDAIVGGHYNRVLPLSGSSWFVQGLWQSALNDREDYKPGDRISVDLGYRYELNDAVGVMLQINALKRWRDSGAQAEPDDTGGEFLFISPGASYAITKYSQLYGFLQIPLYQYVNGVQLVADWSAVVGISARF